MKSIIGFLGAIIVTLVVLVLVLVGYFCVKAGIVPANADTKPTALERWTAKTALDAALERDTKGLKNPVQSSDENLIAGVHLYAANCAICHGASDAGIRFTAMPSFAATLQDEEVWKIAMFLNQMDKLPPTVDAEWKKVPSVAAAPPPK